jgi:hypothetical protein
MAAMGVITILFVQSLVSLAIAVYFFRHHEAEVHLWKTIIAPIISIVGQLFVLYLALTNMAFLEPVRVRGLAGLDRPRDRLDWRTPS